MVGEVMNAYLQVIMPKYTRFRRVVFGPPFNLNELEPDPEDPESPKPQPLSTEVWINPPAAGPTPQPAH